MLRRIPDRPLMNDPATDPTLYTGKWLALSRQGLSPWKVRSVYLVL